ncbi:sigma-70 family RNA polymerase sigma factor [Paraclostridium sordellii]|uniref:sigma-70 family RNA polymerase sigma factor n=1 Tax=Paraclostridium sordellii TaxID=1505 RepID=UPI0030D0645A
MTNEDYMQWIPLIKKIAWKYRNNIYRLELEDLEQIGSIGLIHGFNTYDENRGMVLQNWLYNCVKRTILREFHSLNRIKRQVISNSISIDTPVGGVDDDLTIADIIEDVNINTSKEALENVMIEAYKGEVNIILDGLEHEVAYETLFNDKNLQEVATSKGLEYSKVKNIQYRAFRELRFKSRLIRSKYMELKEQEEENNILNLYKDPAKSIYIREVSKELKEKYKYELDIIDTIQTIFDGLNLYTHNEFVQGFILSLEDILEAKDLVIYRTTIEGNRASLNDKYSFSDIHFVEDRIKKQIAYNKEYVSELWSSYKTTNSKSKINNKIYEFNYNNNTSNQISLLG